MIAAKKYTDTGMFIDESDELLSDLASEFLYSLAEMIAMHKSEQEFNKNT